MKNNFFFKGQVSNIHKRSSKLSEVTSQILYGEKFKILSKNKNWIKIKSSFDNYTGYIKNEKYVNKHNPSHKVYSLKATIFNKQNKKTKKFLPFGSKVSVIKKNKKFLEFENNKWLKISDLKKINHKEKEFFKIFKLFLKTKYVWGGKSYRGIDCSALLQLYYYYNNSFYPRDTKDQIKYSKNNIKRKIFTKGDIIFWKGHVAICINSKELIHAYGPEKKVLVMSIRKTIDRIKKTANLTVKKISPIKY
ncbi:NlpC/P60 family protein [Candidatus Pelagibacter bacterium nBUS_30]|uniref:C40 family peptidase n=1 Tax=Candidatus Pelagibacter bacterium nBUS_30 TaxID=3374191 RepID=UPI003EB9B6E6